MLEVLLFLKEINLTTSEGGKTINEMGQGERL